MMFDICKGCLLALAACLAGCAIEPASQAVVDAYRLIRSEGAAQQSTVGLNPSFRYLRVQIGTREAFLVLGYIDRLPDGAVQVWYSGEGDVLRLRDGRVVGVTIKTGTNWLNVAFANLPRWEDVGSQAAFDRVRDVGPGYRYGIKEKMLVRRIAPPDDTQLRLVPTASLIWFEESVQGVADTPPARYAIGLDGTGAHQVVYAEQCLSSEYCFSWQNWPPAGEGVH